MNKTKLKQLKSLARSKSEEKMIIEGYKKLNRQQREKFAVEYKKVLEQQKAISINKSKDGNNTGSKSIPEGKL